MPIRRTSIYTKTISVTAAQILAMATTPVTLVAAPGANRVLNIISANAYYTYVTTAYTTAGILRLNMGSVAVTTDTSNVLKATANTFVNLIPTVQIAGVIGVNSALTADVTAAITLGDSTVKFIVTYTVEAIN
jgi:hypothetical protein